MGIKRNVVYSSILTTSNYLFPFITYPYVSRVLGVGNIGICNFIDSIVNYYILFSMMGMSSVAVREIAKNRQNEIELSKAFSSLFTLNSISTFIALILLVISIYVVPSLYAHKGMMYIGVFKLVFNYLLIDWLYKGIEDFKYITQRTLIIKILYVILVFIFIRKEEDYEIYYALSVVSIVLNAVINIFHSKHYVRFQIKGIRLTPYLKPFLIIGIYAFLTSMYTSFNVAFLGFSTNEKEVGYYTTAVKLYTILLSLFTAFTGVMMPRMSALIAENKIKEFKEMMEKSITVLLTFAMPLVVFSVIFAPQIISIIAGNGYEKAVIPMRIVMPLMLVIGYEQIIIIQGLMPLGKDKAVLINSILGASIGILMNVLLVPSLKSIGSSLVWVIAEITVLCSAQYFISKYIKLTFPYRKILFNLSLAIPVSILCLIISTIDMSNTAIVILGIILIISYYALINMKVIKNEMVISLWNNLQRKK